MFSIIVCALRCVLYAVLVWVCCCCLELSCCVVLRCCTFAFRARSLLTCKHMCANKLQHTRGGGGGGGKGASV